MTTVHLQPLTDRHVAGPECPCGPIRADERLGGAAGELWVHRLPGSARDLVADALARMQQDRAYIDGVAL